jgi:uncharacterized protein YhaN
MKLRRIRARAFGRFEDFDSGSTTLADLNVVVGPNESGKTTFFHLLHSIIYGLYPASKDQHPYTPWSGRELELEAEIRLESGEEWAVRRKLAGSPTAWLTRQDGVEDLRNRTLACARHVTRDVFRQVFALTLAEIASLESQAWSEIQDRLIGGMGARDLVPARSVAEALETEAKGLWRENRRGRQEIRVLRERIRVAKAARTEALAADRVLREAMRELERTTETLKAARVERKQKRLLIERVTQLLPIRERMDRIARLEVEAGLPGALDGLPADPSAERRRLVEEVASLEERLRKTRADAEEPRERQRAFSADHQAILDARRCIEEVTVAAAASGPVGARLGTLGQEIRDRERRITSDTPKVFERALTGEEESAVRALTVRDLHDRVRDVSAARSRVQEHSMRATLERALPKPSPRTLVAGLVMAVAAAVLLGWPTGGPSTSAPWVRTFGGVLALAASVMCARWWTLRQAQRDSNPGEDTGADAGDRLARASEEAAAVLHAFLSALPVRSEVLAQAGPELVTTVSRIQESLEELETRRSEAKESEATLESVDGRIGELAQRLAIELPRAGVAAIHVLQTQLREAERAAEASSSARAELERVNHHQAELEEELASRRQDLQSLDQLLRRLGGENVGAGSEAGTEGRTEAGIETGIEAAARMRRAREQATDIRNELERSHPNLEAVVARLAELDGEHGGQTEDGDQIARGDQTGDDMLAEAKITVEEWSDQIEALAGQVQDLKNTYERAAERTTADQIDGEINALEDDVRRLVREHDRKIVLAHAIREADHRFREEHQPDVVRRASAYLATITDNRYDRIMVGDSGAFHVRGSLGSDAGASVAAESLSTGAREQLYLAIRLAIMSHLDHDRERLPVFIDEALVNWDAARRNRGFQLLREISQTRQVFVMTCHERWAQELTDAGANRIDLT